MRHCTNAEESNTFTKDNSDKVKFQTQLMF